MPSLRESIPLQGRKIVKKSFGAIIGYAILLGIVAAVVYNISLGADGEPKFVSIGVPVLRVAVPILYGVLLAYAPIYEYLYFSRYYYDMDDRNVTIRKGVFATREIVLPFSRITDVYVDQDLFDALYGLYDVHISTPTAESGQFAHIDGVDKAGAETLRDMLLTRINATADASLSREPVQ